MNQEHRDNDRDEEEPKPGPLALIASVMAAAIGVQSQKNRERDFKHGKASTFIIAGIIFTALFVGTLYLIVSLVISRAG